MPTPRPNRHYVVYQSNAQQDGAPMSQLFEREDSAQWCFDAMAEDPLVNWVKFYTIRGSDGAYLFNEEHQRRTRTR